MVDFDNETTVTRPASDIIRVVILERRYNLMEALERYYMNAALGGVDTSHDEAVVRARLLSLIDELRPMLDRRLRPEEKEELERALDRTDMDSTLKAFHLVNKMLDIVKLIMIDTRKVYDSTNVEAENREKGL